MKPLQRQPLRALPSPRINARSSDRKPLAFLKPAPDPLENLPEQPTNEAQLNAEVQAVKRGFSQYIERQKREYENMGRADYYFCVCFEDGGQAQAFLDAVGYLDSGAMIIDGLLLAERLKIALPEAKQKPSYHNLKRAPDAKLARLVTDGKMKTRIK